MLCLLVTILLMGTFFVGFSVAIPKSGPFKLETEKFANCDDQGAGDIVLGTRITRTSDGRHVFNNPAYLAVPIDEDTKLSVELQSRSNGGYRPRFMHYTFKGCEQMWKYFQDIYKHLQKDDTFIEKCPIPAGNYTIKDFDVKYFQVTNVPSMIYNHYRAILNYYYKGIKVGCFMIYGEAVPK